MQQNSKADSIIAKKIRMLRASKNVSREEFAMYIGINRFSLTNWESGASEPPQNYKEKIDAEFSTAVAEILSLEMESEKEVSNYLTCLQCLPDMQVHALKNLSACIATIIRAKERRK